MTGFLKAVNRAGTVNKDAAGDGFTDFPLYHTGLQMLFHNQCVIEFTINTHPVFKMRNGFKTMLIV